MTRGLSSLYLNKPEEKEHNIPYFPEVYVYSARIK